MKNYISRKIKIFPRQILFALLTVHRNIVGEPFLGHSGVFR